MNRIHANLESLERFGGLLANSGSRIQEIRESLRASLSRMAEDWKDPEYREFAHMFAVTEAALGGFVESSGTFSVHLRTLSQQLRAYLDVTLPFDGSISEPMLIVQADWPNGRRRQNVQQLATLLRPVVLGLHSRWPLLSLFQKLDELQGLQSKIAASQSRKLTPVISSDLGPSIMGVYDGRRIQINQQHLANPEKFWEIIDTLIHEDRHAYQHWAILTPGFHSDPAQVRAWADNYGRYLDPMEVSLRSYRTQPIEADAFSFAENVVLGIIGGNDAG